jgi:glycosyltransferase involved in cell wall biosynthesis
MFLAESHVQIVEFTGVLSGEELARVYARMDVFVFPSETETFGNVVLEALASGALEVAPSEASASIHCRAFHFRVCLCRSR